MVAAKRESEERREAEIRTWLPMAAGLPPSQRRAWLEARPFGDGPAFYRLELRGTDLRALPKESGLRAFRLTAEGKVEEIGQ